eukprot:CAMPEP_0117672668 /NCGR_PEP_ID=MMETSP0804-20121206/14035_1 /TAXON_ID=1074897 /ORGANISM="Tetraselmis astigmatica, Strain CCMP880" /LENGTH=319 /DNA_ID=CAMNT_0005481301 /DNA_START=122 /DNA_END=1079 /DNA_ORIENTATION=+
MCGYHDAISKKEKCTTLESRLVEAKTLLDHCDPAIEDAVSTLLEIRLSVESLAASAFDNTSGSVGDALFNKTRPSTFDKNIEKNIAALDCAIGIQQQRGVQPQEPEAIWPDGIAPRSEAVSVKRLRDRQISLLAKMLHRHLSATPASDSPLTPELEFPRAPRSSLRRRNGVPPRRKHKGSPVVEMIGAFERKKDILHETLRKNPDPLHPRLILLTGESEPWLDLHSELVIGQEEFHNMPARIWVQERDSCRSYYLVQTPVRMTGNHNLLPWDGVQRSGDCRCKEAAAEVVTPFLRPVVPPQLLAPAIRVTSMFHCFPEH